MTLPRVRRRRSPAVFLTLVMLVALGPPAPAGTAAVPPAIADAVLAPGAPGTPEVSTAELERILAERSATVLDARPRREYARGHIPGAVNVAARPGVPISLYVSDVAEVGRLLGGRKDAPLVLYCNGPHCGKSQRLADELLAAGYSNVRRYQLGIPVWRALGGVVEIEREAVVELLAADRTAVFLDARDAAEFRAGSLPGARNLPRSGLGPGKDTGEVKAAKDDGRLPMEDHNTRLVVVGSGAEQARAVAGAVAAEAFHNVAYYGGAIADLTGPAAPAASGEPAAEPAEQKE